MITFTHGWGTIQITTICLGARGVLKKAFKFSYQDEILHQLRLVIYPVIYRFFYIPGGVSRISSINSMSTSRKVYQPLHVWACFRGLHMGTACFGQSIPNAILFYQDFQTYIQTHFEKHGFPPNKTHSDATPIVSNQTILHQKHQAFHQQNLSDSSEPTI